MNSLRKKTAKSIRQHTCLIASVLLVLACTKKSPEATQVSTGPEAFRAQGKQVYMANCIACHNSNPALDGAVGPAIQGSSADLIRTKVLRGEYPEGYSPKRKTKLMAPLPHLESSIEKLAVYLNQTP